MVVPMNDLRMIVIFNFPIISITSNKFNKKRYAYSPDSASRPFTSYQDDFHLWFLLQKFSLATTTGEGNGIPLQYSCLESPLDRGAWWAAVHGVAKSQTWLSDFTFTFHFHALEKKMATPLVFLTGESQGRGSLVGCRLWGRTELDTTEAT